MIQNVNKIKITERKVPTDAEIAERVRDRLAVKAEQELRHLDDRERRALLERFRPVVNALSRSDEGLAELATICALFLREHRPETPASAPVDPTDDRPEHRAPPRGGGGAAAAAGARAGAARSGVRIAFYCGSSKRVPEVYHEAARRLGAALARGRHIMLYGGGRTGLMGSAADAALAAGGVVEGVILGAVVGIGGHPRGPRTRPRRAR